MIEAKGNFRLWRGFVERTFHGNKGVVVVQPGHCYERSKDAILGAKEPGGNCWLEKPREIAHLSRGTRIKINK